MNARSLSLSSALVVCGVVALGAQACGSNTKNGFNSTDGGNSATDSGISFGDDSSTTFNGLDGGGGTMPTGPCQGLQCQQDTCTGSATTSISGYVYDPADKNPLYNIVVYVPIGADKVTAIPKGVSSSTCGECESLYSGTPIAAVLTDSSGHFTLPNAPTGANIPLVVQVGKWRKQYSIANVSACVDNPQSAHFNLPKNGSDGTNASLPDIAVSTGNADTLECLLRRMGVDASEYVPGSSSAGHVHIFQGGGGIFAGVGPTMSGAPASAAGLWDKDGDINKYDIVMLACEGAATAGQNPTVLHDYVTLGGRVFASHLHESWFAAAPFASENIAGWPAGIAGQIPAKHLGDIEGNVITTFPKGAALGQWLGTTNALDDGGTVHIASASNEVGAVNHPPSQEWIHDNKDSATQFFSWDTPINAPPNDAGVPNYCGRVVFSDLHLAGASNDDTSTEATAVPTGCSTADLSPQEKVLEFMLFDLSSCVTSDTSAPQAPSVPVR